MNLNTDNYIYPLPDEKIAKFPLPNRDQSKLLVYRNSNIENSDFLNIQNFIPAGALLIFNNTKVINARFNFKKTSGADIEILCLEPVSGMSKLCEVFESNETSEWVCMVGNAGKWKSGKLELQSDDFTLYAEKLLYSNCLFLIKFSWNNRNVTWNDVLNKLGNVPLPPYLNRKPVEADKERYQTIFAEKYGSIAAPTAALHFTEKVITMLKGKNIKTEFVTLHVGAGTFKPVTTNNIKLHKMHKETFSVGIDFLKRIKAHRGLIIPVGTTAMRTMESLYWIGVMLSANKNFISKASVFLPQWNPYSLDSRISFTESIELLIEYCNNAETAYLEGETEMMIIPGYKYKVCDALITNFHQPSSSLLMLVAAFIGEDWKRVYDFALSNNYRFLSYGDSSLLFKNKS